MNPSPVPPSHCWDTAGATNGETKVTAVTRLRLDEMMVRRGLASTRSAARAYVMAGLVSVDGLPKTKPGMSVTEQAVIAVKKRPRFVSRGGEKLAHALQVLDIDVRDLDAIDVGASTGGFVDCLLQAGASRVVAIDVGRGQLDYRLRNDVRVCVMEKTNARYLKPEMLPFAPQAFTMDLSFISVTKVLPAVVSCTAGRSFGLILVKPQFEAGPKHVGKGGVVRDGMIHRQVLGDLARFVVTDLELDLRGVCDSGLRGRDGNVEYFFYVSRGGEKGYGLDTLEPLIRAAVDRAMSPTPICEA